ncbi:MAG TPA: sigma-70 family RNA polymerase sigma factor [Solirubrobacteraceae bacterium]|nr:sigma-70 family RNA polymerase sigma factor [Solirubrobacteraceae bacterium]
MTVAAAQTPAVAELTRWAALGDQRAWDHLVRRFEPVLRAVLRSYRLDRHDAEDVLQTTWLRAFRHLDRLEDPGALGGWLVVTARREALRLLQREVREVLTDDAAKLDAPDWATGEALVLERERGAAVRASVRRLRGRQRVLVRLLLARPGLSYEEISARLDMPVGSIGPTRDRALARMRDDRRLADVVWA